MMAPGATATLVDFVLDRRFGAHEDAVLERAKLLVLDLLGVACLAAAEDPSVAELATALGGPSGTATAWGLDAGLTASSAALVNGFAAHLLEFDDSTLHPTGHPSVTILPALLAVAEQTSASGRAVLEAFVIGHEVHARLGQAKSANWSSDDAWLPIGTLGLVSATLATCRLAGLTAGQTQHALALSCHFAGQLSANNGSSAKALGAGWAARAAVECVLWARLGMAGVQGALEVAGGFGEVYLSASPADLEAAVARCGQPFYLMETGVAVKRYPSCYGTHWSIDALRKIRSDARLTEAQIETVALSYPPAAAFLDNPAPLTSEEARFSLQYGLAACLVDGAPTEASFRPGRVADPVMTRALGRVSAREATQTAGHIVTVRTRGNEQLRASVRWPHGHPRDPLSAQEVKEKFAGNTLSLGPRAEQVASIVASMESQPDLTGLLALLRPG
jgi:2-methylcitrate dehydratase PrpD